MSKIEEPVRSHGIRILWSDLPGEVRAWVAHELGDLIEVQPQQGGFSPGVAARVRGTRGSGFVKAVGEGINATAAELIALEAEVLRQLPAHVGAPALVSAFDTLVEGERWTGLLVEDIPGRLPQTPWTTEEVSATLAALRQLVARPLAADHSLARLEDRMGASLGHWPAVVADPPADLDPWLMQRRDALVELTASVPERLVGEHLVHGDIRADNLLVTDTGAVRVVDWPEATRGAAWVDTLTLALNVRLLGGPWEAVEEQVADLGATREDVLAVVAGLCGYFLHHARLPDPPGLPTLREFQRVQGLVATTWLRELWMD